MRYFLLYSDSGQACSWSVRVVVIDTCRNLCVFQITHPEADDFFEAFDGFQYIPRTRLKVLYPHG